MSSPLRLLLILPGGVDRSGRERVIPVLLWLIERLARRNRVDVVALHQYPEPERYGLLGAMVYNLGNPPRVPGLALATRWERLEALARERGGWDVIHGFWGGTSGLLAAGLARRLRVPSVVSLAGGELVWQPEIGYGSQGTWRARMQVTLALRLASRVTVSSGFMEGLAAARGLRTERVPLGVDDTCFRAGRAAEGPPWRLLHVASLNRVKDQATLLRALRRVVDAEPRVHLDIVGEDTLGGAVQRQSEALGLGQYVRFHGFQPSDVVRERFAQAHVFLLPSRHDAAPVAVLEAAACGVTTVGTQVGYIADWHGTASLAVPVGDDAALADATLALLRNPARRIALGEAARAWTLAHDANWTAARFEALYRELRD